MGCWHGALSGLEELGRVLGGRLNLGELSHQGCGCEGGATISNVSAMAHLPL